MAALTVARVCVFHSAAPRRHALYGVRSLEKSNAILFCRSWIGPFVCHRMCDCLSTVIFVSDHTECILISALPTAWLLFKLPVSVFIFFSWAIVDLASVVQRLQRGSASAKYSDWSWSPLEARLLQAEPCFHWLCLTFSECVSHLLIECVGCSSQTLPLRTTGNTSPTSTLLDLTLLGIVNKHWSLTGRY